MLKALILEDEPNGLENLKNLLAQNTPNVKVVSEAGTIKEGLELLRDPEKHPDIVFLDINLPDGLVFKLLDQLPEIRFEIIFVTAYEKFAKKACSYASIGYVTKPIDPDELIGAVSRVRKIDKDNSQERYEIFKDQYFNPNPFNKISIPSSDKIHLVDIKDIMFLKGEDNLTQFTLVDGRKIWCSKTLGTYENFEAFNFFRIHKNCMVNLNYIEEYVRGDGYVVMADKAKLEVSRRNKPILMKRLK
jgi:two-component system LytT family response regulator